MATSSIRIDQIDGALQALAKLFDESRWSELPQQSVLDKHTDYRAFAARFPTVKRDAVKRQHMKWRSFGSDGLLDSATMDSDAISLLIEEKLGNDATPHIIAAAFKRASESRFAQQRGGLADLISFFQDMHPNTDCSVPAVPKLMDRSGLGHQGEQSCEGQDDGRGLVSIPDSQFVNVKKDPPATPEWDLDQF